MRIETSRTLLLLVSVAFFAAVSKAAEFDDINEEELRLLDDEKFTPEEKRAAFVGMRGRRSDEEAQKRAVNRNYGFTGMRGKKSLFNEDDVDSDESDWMLKRAGFVGMRGKKAGFVGMRGKKAPGIGARYIPFLYQDLLRNRYHRNFNADEDSYYYPVKDRRSSGFVGMRG